MPIEVSTRKLKKRDLTSAGSSYHAPYVPVYQYGYGRMDSSTPGEGLMTCKVASCLAVVLHCPTTGRTILTHSPNYLYMNTFVPIVDWITGGTGQDLYLPAWYEGVGARHCEVDVVVLRGFLYATAEAMHYGHDEWMQDFRGLFSLLAPPRHIRVNILDAPRVLTHGAVLVDKDTARITYLEVEARARPRSADPIVDSFLDVQNPLLPHVYSQAQRSQDLFVGMLLGSQRVCPPIILQYDVSRYCLPMPLLDYARQLIRSKKLGEPLASQREIIRNLGQSVDWLDPHNPQEEALLRRLFYKIVTIGPPCERCGDSGSKRCTACMGAWYCGEKHQKEDWKAHKDWCKAHRVLDLHK